MFGAILFSKVDPQRDRFRTGVQDLFNRLVEYITVGQYGKKDVESDQIGNKDDLDQEAAEWDKKEALREKRHQQMLKNFRKI